MNRLTAAIALSATVIAAVPPAFAKFLENYGDWSTFAEKEGGKPLCYMASEPKKAEGKYKKRDAALVLVTHRPAEKAVGVVSIQAGYPYKKESGAEVTIGAETFKLFTDAGHAWAKDGKMDKALVAAMKAGTTMTVVGVSAKGTKTRDTYSLKGFTRAYHAISKACKVGK